MTDDKHHRVLTQGVDAEELADRLGIREDQLCVLLEKYGEDIQKDIESTIEESIIALAHHEGMMELGEPEIPEGVERAAEVLRSVSGREGVVPLIRYDDS